ncbi:unnamed protein product [Caenorhabditis brenneri]
MAERCMVCRREKNTFKLDNCAACCKGCRQFYQKMTKYPEYLVECAEKNHSGRKKCRYCYYQRCLRAGIGGKAASGGV